MQNLRQFLSLQFFALFIAAGVAFGQPAGPKVGPQFPFLTSSSRVASLGDASGAIIDDFSGFGSNPGALGLIKRSLVDYSTQRVQQGITFEHIGMAYKISKVEGIGFAFDILHYGGPDFYTDNAVRKLGYEVRTGVAYGRQVGKDFSLGANLQAFSSTTGTNAVWAFAGDVGFSYAPGKYIRYGMFIKGLSTDYDTKLQILQSEVFSSRMARILGISVAIDYPFSEKTKKLLFIIQNEKIFGERVLIYKMGFEFYPIWSPATRVAFRAGLIARENESEPRLGLGTGYYQFNLDYAYRYTKRFYQPSHMFTLTYEL